MDATVLATVLGAVAAGAGSLLVPTLIARIPEVAPEVPVPAGESDASVVATPAPSEKEPEPPPEPFADIARLPGLAVRSAVAGAVAGAIIGASVGWTWALVLLVALVPVSVALAVVDWRTRLLPTAVIRPTYLGLIGLLLVGALVTRDPEALLRSALGWLVAGGLFALLWFIYPRGLGFGDVRLAGVLGLALGWLGWGPLLVGVYAGFLLGGVLGGLLSAMKLVERKGFPFGPFMLIGALVGVVWGADLWTGLVTG